MVKARQASRTSGSLGSTSTSTQNAHDPHAPVDSVASGDPCQPEFLPSTEIDDQSGTYATEQSPPQDCPTTSTGEKKANWIVDVIDEQGVKTEQELKLHDVWHLPAGLKVVLPFDRFKCPTTDAAALFSQFLGNCAKDTITFPINVEDWRKIPKTLKDKYFNDTILPKFHFENVNLEQAMDYTRKTLGRKRHDFKLQLWNFAYDPLLSMEEMQNKIPPGVDKGHWASYVNYRFNDKTKSICKKNKVNSKKQRIPHTGGSKSLPRRRAEMENKRGELVDRGELYIVTHKKKDGTFVNEKAKIISEKIRQKMQEMSQNPPTRADPMSRIDALGKVLGKEHPGRVRSMGFGPTPSSVFGLPTRAYGNVSSSSGSGGSHTSSQMVEKISSLEAELAAERERRNALEGALLSTFREMFGVVPPQLANFISCPPAAQNNEREDNESGDSSSATLSMSYSGSHEPGHN